MSRYNDDDDDDDDGNDDNDDEKDYLAGATTGFQLAIVVLAIGTRPAILRHAQYHGTVIIIDNYEVDDILMTF